MHNVLRFLGFLLVSANISTLANPSRTILVCSGTYQAESAPLLFRMSSATSSGESSAAAWQLPLLRPTLQLTCFLIPTCGRLHNPEVAALASSASMALSAVSCDSAATGTHTIRNRRLLPHLLWHSQKQRGIPPHLPELAARPARSAAHA